MFIRVLGALLLTAISIQAAPVGQIQVDLAPGLLGQSQLSVHIGGAALSRFPTKVAPAIFWDLPPGSYEVELFAGDTAALAQSVVLVYGGMTTRLEIRKRGDSWLIDQRGFADQDRVQIELTQYELADLPGNSREIASSFLGTDIGSALSWEGISLEMQSSPEDATLVPHAIGGNALIAPGRPISIDRPPAGFSFDCRESGSLSYAGTYGTRDARYHTFDGQTLLRKRDMQLFGTGAFQNLADAQPRANVDYRLPHNQFKSSYLLGGMNGKVSDRIRFESRIWVAQSDRWYYLHPYIYDIDHSPRGSFEVGVSENEIRAQVSGRLTASILGGWQREDRSVGDGVYFDSVLSYYRMMGNPRFDSRGLTYSYDDPSTPEDESHVYEGYESSSQSEWHIGGKLEQQVSPGTRIGVHGDFERGTFRKYHNYFPTTEYYRISSDAIGFDTLGATFVDSDRFGSVPHPTTWRLSSRFQTLQAKYSATARIEYVSFKSGQRSLRSMSNPFDPDNTAPSEESMRLDPKDLKETSPLSHINFEAGAVFHLGPTSDFFARSAYIHRLPAPEMLYLGYDFLEYKVLTGGYFVAFGNPELSATLDKEFAFGGTVRTSSAAVSAEIGYKSEEVPPMVYNVAARPRAYSIYEDGEGTNSAAELMIAAKTTAPSVFKGLLAAKVGYGSRDVTLATMNTAPVLYYNYRDKHISYNLAAAGELDFANLPAFREARSGLRKLARGVAVSVLGNWRSPQRYSPTQVYNEVTLYDVYYLPSYPTTFRSMTSFSEIGVAIRATLADTHRFSARVRLEVLNLFDRKNVLAVYTGTGLPDNSGWLDTQEGKDFSASNDIPDRFGLTGSQEYKLMEDNPAHFGRPRTLRVALEVSL